MNSKQLLSLSATLFSLILLTPAPAFSQSAEQQGKPREITSSDFTRERPSKPKAPSSENPPPKKPRPYILVRTEPATRRRRPKANRPPGTNTRPPKQDTGEQVTASFSQEQIGITLWRLRPSTSEDTGPLIPVYGLSGKSTMWVPVRAKADQVFNVGERVRITVESPQSGYLYVIDREAYSDGTLGEAMLIFPTKKTRDGDNRVAAGYLIDIPAWGDRTPYFVIEPTKPKYKGELLTFIVSPQPLSGLAIGQWPVPVARERIEEWEEQWGTEVDLYEMEGGAGESQTTAEQQAAQPRTRQLIQNEPVPQTIYRVKIRRGDPLLVNVLLRVKLPDKP